MSIPPPPSGAPTRASSAPEIRRVLLQMVVGVVLLDVAALALKRHLLVDAWPERRRLFFTAVWMLATLGIVGSSLARIRAFRLRARHAPTAAGRGR